MSFDRLSLPRIWLFSDARNDDTLDENIVRLPSRSGVLFRHYHLDVDQRRRRFDEVRRRCTERNHCLLLAANSGLAEQWGADGFHDRTGRKTAEALLHSAAVHTLEELKEAERNGADLLFVSPVHATRSHPGASPIDRDELRVIMAKAEKPVILLGGMNADRFKALTPLGAYGWGAIDALS